MIQRLFFDGIHGEAAGAAVTGHDDLVVKVLSDETKAALLIVQFTEPGTQVALNPAIVQGMPVAIATVSDVIL